MWYNVRYEVALMDLTLKACYLKNWPNQSTDVHVQEWDKTTFAQY